MKRKPTRTPPAVRRPLPDAQFAERRSGLMAALHMLQDIMRTTGGAENYREEDAYFAARDQAFDTACEKALSYLRAFGAQTEHAQRGFSYIIGCFFGEYGEGGTPHPDDYEHAVQFANPPLTISQADQADRRPARHNGAKPTGRQLAAAARRWLAAKGGDHAEG